MSKVANKCYNIIMEIQSDTILNNLIVSSNDPYEIIDAYRAWDIYYELRNKEKLGSPVIGVLDTMFYDDHEDLRGILKSDTSYLCESSHGTHVAGIIGARYRKGNRGVFPDAKIIGKSINTKLILPIYKFSLNNNRISKSPLISNIQLNYKLYDLLNNHNKIVINCSFGYNDIVQKYLKSNNTVFHRRISKERTARNSILLNAIRNNKDFLIVQSSGNFSHTKKFDDKYMDSFYSSHFVSMDPELSKRIITVGALKDEHTIWNSSQLGDMVDILAPGFRIKSTVSLEENINSNIKGGYANLTGTSMAAPFVSGVAGMIWYLFPDLTGANIKDILVKSGKSIYNLEDKKTYKRLNAYNSLLYANIFGDNPYIDNK